MIIYYQKRRYFLNLCSRIVISSILFIIFAHIMRKVVRKETTMNFESLVGYINQVWDVFRH